MSWTWKHYIPNYASATNGPATATMVTGDDLDEYPVSNVIDDDPFVPCKFNSQDTGTGLANIKLEGVKNGVGKQFFAIINDTLPPTCELDLYVTDGVGTWYMFQNEPRGTDATFIYEWADHAEDDHDEWVLNIDKLGGDNPFQIGSLYLGRVIEFRAQPTLPLGYEWALGREISETPGGSAFRFKLYDRLNWILAWEHSPFDMGGISSGLDWPYLWKGASWIMHDPIMQSYFAVRFKTPPGVLSNQAKAGDTKLYRPVWHLEQTWGVSWQRGGY